MVLLDAEAREIARVGVAPQPTTLARGPRSSVLVGSAGSQSLQLLDVAEDGFGAPRRLTWPGHVPASVERSRDGWVLGDVRQGQLFRWGGVTTSDGELTGVTPLAECRGVRGIQAVGATVLANCQHDRRLLLLPAHGEARFIAHDGPMFAFDAVEHEGDLYVAVVGVEDHPLVRRDGGFGYIDSFATLYRVSDGHEPELLRAVNLSELGVVTPKTVTLTLNAGTAELDVTGYASATRVRLRFSLEGRQAPVEVTGTEGLPGIAARAGALAANPLLDAWVLLGEGGDRLMPLAEVNAQPESVRLGELLFFTTLMAPFNTTAGENSRFTCETCHWEGGVDGRVHYTGRGEVHATTRPLWGIFNNRPHFSRGLDRTSTKMVHAEFRVANAHDHEPWFGVDVSVVPWLGRVPGLPRAVDPETLRRSLLEFFAAFTHRPNPMVHGREAFSALERRGAELFAERCEGCHQAVLDVGGASGRVPPERWASLIFSEAGPLVWGRAEYAQTGVTPYVHDSGARPPSLRRLSEKYPYFTNGSARSLTQLVQDFGWDEARIHHADRPGGARRLDGDQVEALVAFLGLL